MKTLVQQQPDLVDGAIGREQVGGAVADLHAVLEARPAGGEAPAGQAQGCTGRGAKQVRWWGKQGVPSRTGPRPR